jgi:hypothetical protein
VPGAFRSDRDERLTGLHADPHGEREVAEALVELVDREGDPKRAQQRSLRVVLVRDGSPVHRHDGIADELLDRAAEAFDLAAHPIVIAGEGPADVLGIGPIGAGRELHEVAEQDRDDLAFLARTRSGPDRGATGSAELCGVGVVVPAGVTGRHARQCMAADVAGPPTPPSA